MGIKSSPREQSGIVLTVKPDESLCLLLDAPWTDDCAHNKIDYCGNNDDSEDVLCLEDNALIYKFYR
jgi:hypothetical protein